MISTELRSFCLAAILGIAGGIAASLMALPAPFLIGPAAAVTVGGLAGLDLTVPQFVRDACFIIIGVSMGSTLTPDIVDAIKTWPLSFAMVLIAVVLLLYSAAWVLRRLFGYDRVTALLAASPGHLSYVLSLASEMRCDLRTVSISQSVRVLALTVTVPLIVEVFDLAGGEAVIAAEAMAPLTLALIIGAAAAFGVIFRRLRLPAALVLGGLLVSLSTHVTGYVSGSVPSWLLIPTYILLGTLIGTRFSGVSLADLRKALVSGLVVTLVVTLLAASIAILVSRVAGVPLDAALIAFSPGGLETMAAMAVMLHADPTYVGAHHVLRLMFLSVLMPLVLGKEARQR